MGSKIEVYDHAAGQPLARIGGILSDVFGVNGRKILDGLAQGSERSVILASLTSHVAYKLDGLGEALSLSLGQNDRFMLHDLLQEHDALEARIASYTRRIDEQLASWEEQRRLLTTIPGIDRTAAAAILIEIGLDIGVFASAECLAAWAGLCPGNDESGGKRRKTRTRPGSKTLRATLVECAHGAARTKGCQFEARHRALAARRGYKRAIVATAHRMLRIIHVVLKNARPYYDRSADYEALLVKRNAPRWIRMLRRYGYVAPAQPRIRAA